jgi:hypothetical protein
MERPQLTVTAADLNIVSLKAAERQVGATAKTKPCGGHLRRDMKLLNGWRSGEIFRGNDWRLQ